jgi:hypothetical protein
VFHKSFSRIPDVARNLATRTTPNQHGQIKKIEIDEEEAGEAQEDRQALV